MTATSGKEWQSIKSTFWAWPAPSENRRSWLSLKPGQNSLVEQQKIFNIQGRWLARSRSSAITQTLILLSFVFSQVSGANVDRDQDIAAISSTSTSSLVNQPGESGRKQVASDMIAIKEGGDLDLSCPIVVQDEDMIISWTCDNEPANIRSSRIHVTDSGKLRIHSAKVGDSCNYRCEAADGFETFSVIIKVIIVDRRLMDQLTRRAGVIGNSDSAIPSDGSRVVDRSQDAARVSSNSQNDQQKSLNQVGRQIKGPSDGGLEIEMQIEPSEVHVSKNRTFSLECRIKHASNLVAPQIIWLKEYIGTHVDSLDEALDKNLIVLDGVYYHTLNWPRALSYSKQSSTVSSALLIKQSSFVHSGRYSCFAGYPASIMNLHYNNSLSDAMTDQNSQQNGQYQSRPPMRYKIAQAWVKVDDAEGEANYKSSINYLSKSPAEEPRQQANIFVSVVASNTWIRNLTIVLLLVCLALGVYRYFSARRIKVGKSFQENLDGSSSSNNPGSNSSRGLVDSQQPVAFASVTEPPSDRSILSHVPANSLINDNNPLGELYKFDQALLNERLNCIDSTNSFSNNDHIYSEIGYKITINSSEEPHYKQPIRLNKQ